MGPQMVRVISNFEKCCHNISRHINKKVEKVRFDFIV